MKLTNIIEEDFVNYRKPGMFLGFPYCSGKCNQEAGKIVCQNQVLQNAELIDISAEEILERFYKNPIPECLIFGGLEPFDSFDDIMDILVHLKARESINKWKKYFSYNPRIVIYTGYYPFEIKNMLFDIADTVHPAVYVAVKFGRYLPGYKPHFDPILGVHLASDNQFAMWITDQEASFFDIAFEG